MQQRRSSQTTLPPERGPYATAMGLIVMVSFILVGPVSAAPSGATHPSGQEPAIQAETAGFILPGGQEKTAERLLTIPTLPAATAIVINRGEITATWADGRLVRLRHPASKQALPPGHTRIVETANVLVFAPENTWKTPEIQAISAQIKTGPSLRWIHPAARKAHAKPADQATTNAELRRIDAVMHQAEEAMGIGEKDKARRILNRMRQTKLADAGQRARLGSLLQRVGEKAAGTALLERAIAELASRVQAHPEVKPRWISALARQDPTKAETEALAAVAKAPAAKACVWAPVAHALHQAGATTAAQKVAQAVLDKDKKCERAWVVRGLTVHQSLTEWRASLAIAEAGLKHLPTSLPLLNMKAGALHSGFKNREAAKVWEQIARRDLQFPGVLGMLATAWTQRSDLLDDDFLAPLYARLKTDPDDVVSRYIIGTANYYRGDMAAVIKYLDPLRARVPREPRVHLYTAMAHFHLGHKKKAEERLATLQTFGHNDPDYYYCRSVMRRNTDFEGSLRDLERFVALSKGRQNSPAKIFKMHRELDVMRSGRIPNAFDILPDWLRWAIMAAVATLIAGLGLGLLRWRRRKG